MPFTCESIVGTGIDTVAGPGLSMSVRRCGAELVSLIWQDPHRGPVPLLWRDGLAEDPPRYWKSHAPILFPIVGGLHDNSSKTTAGDVVHFNGLHGFVRHNDLEKVHAGPSEDGFELKYRLTANPTTRAMYPWEFVFEVSYTLRTDRLDLTLAVENRDSRPMPYQLGWHPGFRTPFLAGSREKNECHVRLPTCGFDRLLNDERCFLTGQRVPMDGSGDFQFSELGLDLTYMFDLAAHSAGPAQRLAAGPGRIIRSPRRLPGLPAPGPLVGCRRAFRVHRALAGHGRSRKPGAI